jgi:hypothetical protein
MENNVQKPLKIIFIPLLIFILGSSFILIGLAAFQYLDTQVYKPIGVLSQDKAFFLKEIGIFVGLPFLLSTPAAFLLIPLFSILTIRSWKRPLKRFIFLALTALTLESAILAKIELKINRDVFHKTFFNLVARTEPLISAIEAHKTTKGEYPHKLEDLVPEFIPAIPDTNLAGYPKYEYNKAGAKTPFKQYEVLVQTSIGILNWDVFVYWPEGKYPDRFYGGYSEPFEKWAYVHE